MYDRIIYITNHPEVAAKMKLPAELLWELLKNTFNVLESSLPGYHRLLGRPILHNPAKAAQNEKLYICDTAARELCRANINVIYTGGSRPAERSSCYICLEEDAVSVFNAVQDIFDRFDEWEEALDAVLLNHGSLGELLAAAQTGLDNPLVLMDANLSPVSCSESEESSASWAAGTVFSPSESVFDPKQNAFYVKMRERKEPYICPPHILGRRTLNLNIHYESRTSHHLMLVEHRRALRSGDEWLLGKLAAYVEYFLKLERPEYQPDSRLHALFMRLLSDKAADPFEFSLQLSKLDWSAEDEYFCLVLKTAEAKQMGEASEQICGYLKKQYPASCSCIYDGDIVTYFNLTRLDKSLDRIDDELKYFVREHLLKAGYSRSMAGHANLRRQYIQASAALRIGEHVQPYVWIHRFNRISMRFALEEAMHRLPGDMLCHEKLLALLKYDREQGTEYARTLRVYLDHSLNAVQTAKALFIHRSTFLYRLAKIKEMLDTSLSDPEELLYLSISFRLMEGAEQTG